MSRSMVGPGNLRRGIALGRDYGKCESCWLSDVGVADLTHDPREFSSLLLCRVLFLEARNFH